MILTSGDALRDLGSGSCLGGGCTVLSGTLDARERVAPWRPQASRDLSMPSLSPAPVVRGQVKAFPAALLVRPGATVKDKRLNVCDMRRIGMTIGDS